MFVVLFCRWYNNFRPYQQRLQELEDATLRRRRFRVHSEESEELEDHESYSETDICSQLIATPGDVACNINVDLVNQNRFYFFVKQRKETTSPNVEVSHEETSRSTAEDDIEVNLVFVSAEDEGSVLTTLKAPVTSLMTTTSISPVENEMKMEKQSFAHHAIVLVNESDDDQSLASQDGSCCSDEAMNSCVSASDDEDLESQDDSFHVNDATEDSVDSVSSIEEREDEEDEIGEEMVSCHSEEEEVMVDKETSKYDNLPAEMRSARGEESEDTIDSSVSTTSSTSAGDDLEDGTTSYDSDDIEVQMFEYDLGSASASISIPRPSIIPRNKKK